MQQPADARPQTSALDRKARLADPHSFPYKPGTCHDRPQRSFGVTSTDKRRSRLQPDADWQRPGGSFLGNCGCDLTRARMTPPGQATTSTLNRSCQLSHCALPRRFRGSTRSCRRSVRLRARMAATPGRQCWSWWMTPGPALGLASPPSRTRPLGRSLEPARAFWGQAARPKHAGTLSPAAGPAVLCP